MKAALLFLTTALLGFGVGWHLKPTPSPDELHKTADPKSAQVRRAESRAAGAPQAHVYSKAPPELQGKLLALAALPDAKERYRAAYAMIQSLSHDELLEWIEGNYNEMDGDLNDFIFNALVERLLEVDPASLAGICVRNLYNVETTARILKDWATRDPSAVMDFVTEQKNWSQSGWAFQQALAEAAKQDPQKALATVVALLKTGTISHYFVIDTCRVLAEKNPTELWETCQDWPREAREQALQKLAERELLKDFTSGLEWARANGVSGVPDLSNLFKTNPELAGIYLESFGNLPSGWSRDLSGFTGAVKALAETDLPAALAAMAAHGIQMPTLNRDSHPMTSLYTELAGTRDSSLIVESILANDQMPPEKQSQLLSEIYQQLAAAKPREAEAWLAALPDEETRQAAVTELEQVRGQRPFACVSAGEIFTAFSSNPSPSEMASRISAMNPTEFPQVIEAYRNLDDKLRESVKPWLLGSGSIPPELTAACLELESVGPDYELRTGVNLASRWASESPAAAAAWFESLPPERQSPQISEVIFNTWSQMNEQEANDWAGRFIEKD